MSFNVNADKLIGVMKSKLADQEVELMSLRIMANELYETVNQLQQEKEQLNNELATLRTVPEEAPKKK